MSCRKFCPLCNC